MAFNTPNVYLQQQTVQEATIAPGTTAVPVFIGYTEQATDNDDNSLLNVSTLITSLADYEAYYGGANEVTFTATVDIDDNVTALSYEAPQFLMYYNISLYFKNGGSPCYILSVGDYDATPSYDDFSSALTLLESEESPTLICFSDAVSLSTDDYYSLCQQALAQCYTLKDRFAILDVQSNTTDSEIEDFRSKIDDSSLNTELDADTLAAFSSGEALSYGAAYYPYLNSSLTYNYDDSGVTVLQGYPVFEIENGIRVSYKGSDTPSIEITHTTDSQSTVPLVEVVDDSITFYVAESNGSSTSAVMEAWDNVADTGDFIVETNDVGSAVIVEQQAEFSTNQILATLADSRITVDYPTIYDNVVTAIAQEMVPVPASPVVTAIYSYIDNEYGPWRAPANVPLQEIIGPVVSINNFEQEDMNVDGDGSGKSINAIRSFAGQGVRIWGCRSLNANSNDWRYVPVKRLLIKIESDIKRATAFSVFEPNTAVTWLKIRTLLTSYLDDLWTAGALTGSSADEAYFVQLGTGETMTEDDVLDGLLKITVGVAAARPAEFIVINVTQLIEQN